MIWDGYESGMVIAIASTSPFSSLNVAYYVHIRKPDPITGAPNKNSDTGNCSENKQLQPMLQLELIPGSIAEIFVSAAETQALTDTDRYGLLAAILTEDIGEEERMAINRILRSVSRGYVTIE